MQILRTVLELFHPRKRARGTIYSGAENTPKKYSVLLQTRFNCEISGFRRQVDDNCALLCYYAACSGNSLTTLQDNLSVPSSRVNNL